LADDRLMAFMVALATDPMRLEAWLENAEGAMIAAGLDEAERAVVRSGDPRTIYGRLTNTALPSSTPPASLPTKDP
jgi:hypothetical protein